MPNNIALCDIPALPILAKNAGIRFAVGDVVQLRTKHGRAHPAEPTIRLALSRRRLVSPTAARGVVDIFARELHSSHGHICPACAKIMEYNAVIENFGSFVQHLGSVRENAQLDVAQTISIASGYALPVIDGLRRRRTVPSHVSDSVLNACRQCFPDHTGRFRLAVRTLLPQQCKPLAHDDGRLDVAMRYIDDFCTRANGCSG